MSTQAYEYRRSGWLDFAAIIMFSIGFFRIISAIDFFANKHRINNFSGGLFTGHAWGWGVWDLIIATVAILAALSLLAGHGFGRVMGYIFGVLVIVQGFAVLNLAPWYGAMAITLGVLAVYGIAVTPGRET